MAGIMDQATALSSPSGPDLHVADPELLARFLADRDAPCPGCGYNLRNLTGDRCPECGDALVLRVNIAEPRLAALIAGLVGLSAGAGLNGLLVLYGLIRIAIEGRYNSYMGQFFVTTGIGGVVLGYSLRLWLHYWPRIRRASRATQRILVIAAWALSIVDLVIFSVVLK